MGGELRDKVASGVAWSLGEKVGTVLLQMVVSIVVARMLVPDDVGLMAIMSFFSSLAMVIADSGFSQMLIRKEHPAPGDYKAVFIFNVVASWVMYLLLVAIFPWIAGYYDRPVLAQIAPVLFLLVPINALGGIQNTVFSRQFRFALLSKVIFVSSLVSGAIAVTLALAGCGVWALVGQRVSAIAVKVFLLWALSDWRPRGERFSSAPLREMAPYSLRLLATELIAAVYARVAQLFIGKIYSPGLLGFFSQAQKLEEVPVLSTVQSVQNVTFPALSRIDDEARFAESYRQVMMVVAFVIFPVMAGLSAVAPDLFALLLGEKWMPTVPYFRALCWVGYFAPLTAVAYNVLKARSDGRIIVRLEFWKKILMTFILAAAIPQSVLAVAWGLSLMAAAELLFNLAAAARFCSLTLRRLARTLCPVALLTAVMYGCVTGWLVPRIADLSTGLRLMLQILTGAAVYAILGWAFRLEAMRACLSILYRFLLKR